MRLSIPIALFAFALPAGAANAPATRPPACGPGSAHRQFDFWIGHWDVRDPAGTLQGHSRIERVLGGCGIAEHWDGAKGTHGVSYNAFDAPAKVWRQFWIDDTGQTVLQLEGGLEDTSMVLRGSGAATAGKPATLQRIRWTPQADGSVRQLWQQSADAGATWTTAFDGIYRKTD